MPRSSRCYWCGQPVDELDLVMLNVILGIGRGYTRWSRKPFHRDCAGQAKAKGRRTAGWILLGSAGVAAGLLAAGESVFAILVGVLGVVLALLEVCEYW